MTTISRANGWTYDLAAQTMSWPGVDATTRPLPLATLASLAYFGAGYLESQAAGRSVTDKFRKDALDELRRTNPDAKAKDVSKDALPDSESAEYRDALLAVHKDLWAKQVAGYEVGIREGAVDPVTAELHKLGAQWLQGFATAQGWYSLPAKRKVAKLDDAYADPKGRYATFGDALEAFVASRADSTLFDMRDQHGKPWPIKTKKGESLADLLLTEAKARAAAKDAAKPGLTLGAGAADVDF